MSRKILKWLIVGTVAYAVICMLHWPIGFTMFTQLSNLFVAVVAVLQLAAEGATDGQRASCESQAGKDSQGTAAKDGRGLSEGYLRTLHYLKFSAVVSITVTMVVYAAVIAPLSSRGIVGAYLQDHGASLCMHLLVPLLTLADFYLHDVRQPYERICLLWSLLPPFLWLLMIGFLGACGLRWHGGMAAPYPFLNYLAPAGWLGWAPETLDRTTLGVGVVYMILAMMVLFCGIAGAHYRWAGK